MASWQAPTTGLMAAAGAEHMADAACDQEWLSWAELA
jgi:hypothetical protein